MKRVVVLGGLGLFGRTIIKQLRGLGLIAQSASRRGLADVRVDANDGASIRAALRPGDLVIDAAGPFQARTAALIQAAIEIGFDVIDLNDDLSYAESVIALEPQIAAAGIRVLSSASSVSAVSAAVVQHSGIASPRRVTSFLAPATRHTANSGTAVSLLRSVGRPIRVLSGTKLMPRMGWSEKQEFVMPPPIGSIEGRLFESADVLYLPTIWPTLSDVSMYVDTHTIGANTLLRLAAVCGPFRTLLEQSLGVGTWLAKKFGSSTGGIGYEIEGANGHVAKVAIVATANSYLTAVAPAVLATREIALGALSQRGLIMPDQHVEPDVLFAYLAANDITVSHAD